MREVASYSYSLVYQTSQNPDPSRVSYAVEAVLALVQMVVNAVAVVFTGFCHAKSRERTQFSAKAFGVATVGVFSPSAAKRRVDQLMQKELFPERVRKAQAQERHTQFASDTNCGNFALLFTEKNFFKSVTLTILRQATRHSDFKQFLTDVEEEIPDHLLLTPGERTQMRQLRQHYNHQWPAALRALFEKAMETWPEGREKPDFEVGEWASMSVDQKLAKIEELAECVPATVDSRRLTTARRSWTNPDADEFELEPAYQEFMGGLRSGNFFQFIEGAPASETGRSSASSDQLFTKETLRRILSEIEEATRPPRRGEEGRSVRQQINIDPAQLPLALEEAFQSTMVTWPKELTRPTFEVGDWAKMSVETKLAKIEELARIALETTRIRQLYNGYYNKALMAREFNRGDFSKETVIKAIQTEYERAENKSDLLTIWIAVKARLLAQLESDRASNFEVMWVPRHITEKTFITPILHSSEIPEEARTAFVKFKTDVVKEVKEQAGKREQRDWMQLVNRSKANRAFKAVLYPVASAKALASALAVKKAHEESAAFKLVEWAYLLSSLLTLDKTYYPEQFHLLFNLNQLIMTTESILRLFSEEIGKFPNPLVSEDWIQDETATILMSLSSEIRSAKPLIPPQKDAVVRSVRAKVAEIKEANEQARGATFQKYVDWQRGLLDEGAEFPGNFIAAQTSFRGTLVDEEDGLHLPMDPKTHQARMDGILQSWASRHFGGNLLSEMAQTNP